MKGLILAAGRGERLNPLTQAIPKALISIGPEPLIHYPLLGFKRAGIKDVGVVIQAKDYPKFRSCLRVRGVKVKYIFQRGCRGTAKAIAAAGGFIGQEPFILCWCDFMSPFDFRKIISEHLRFRPVATVLINKEADPRNTAQVLFRRGYITKIVERPRRRFSSWGAAGVNVLEPDIFSALRKITPSARGEYDLAAALQLLIDQGRRVRLVRLTTWRINVNTLRDLRRAQLMLESKGVSFWWRRML